MRRYLVATAALLALITQGAAQDATWDRWFVGFDAGYLWRSETSTADGTLNSSGATIGLSAGKWWQLDQFAFGLDLGIAFGGAARKASSPGTGGLGAWNYSTSETVSVAARIKGGVPMENLLPYAALGLQTVHSVDQFTWLPSIAANGTETSVGATIAAGIEYLVTQNTSVRAEYGINLKFPNSASTTSFSGHGGKIGLNYYFN